MKRNQIEIPRQQTIFTISLLVASQAFINPRIPEFHRLERRDIRISQCHRLIESFAAELYPARELYVPFRSRFLSEPLLT